MIQKQAFIKTTNPDDALRSSDFILLPTNERPPIITSHPIRNFYQLTWGSISRTGKFKLKEVTPVLDTFTIRKGTAIEWSLYCVDPSNLSNINDISTLKFTWKRDGYDLYTFNRQNGGRGVSTIQYSVEQSTEEIEGEYICEVSNEAGTTTTTPFTLRILDVDNYNQLYTNLILNGDADGGLDGWTNNDGNIITATGKDKVIFNQNTITNYSEFYPISTGLNYLPPTPFRFNTKIPEQHLFYKGYKTWLDRTNGQLLNYNIVTATLPELDDSLKWSSFKTRASIIPNEDYQRISNSAQGFFPGPNWIDKYNRNIGAGLQSSDIGLSIELGKSSRPLNYFTRTNLQFNQNPSTEMSQTVALTDLSSLIQGSVGGINNLTAQVFAYVGVALSRCTIRATVGGVVVDYNWLVHDLDTYRKYISGIEIPKILPDLNTPIEIIQHTDDTTTLELEAIDDSGRVVKVETINGPRAIDLWAVKEKVDYALTLFPIFAFFANQSNPIQIFGQTYTTTSALSQLFTTKNGEGYLDNSNIGSINTTDVNLEFITKRYGDVVAQNAAYGEIWEEDNTTDPDGNATYSNIVAPTRQKRALPDFGIQAFFGVGATVDLPSTTNRLRLVVRFTNNTPSLTDNIPESKEWTDAEIYNTVFNINSADVNGNATTTSNPLYSYGSPRCAITKIKLLIVPDRDIASPKHITYALPPASSTVSGIARNLLLQNVHNATTKATFAYDLIQPAGLPPSPNPTLSDVQQQEENDITEAYLTSERAGKLDTLQSQPDDLSAEALERARNFDKDSIDVEEADRIGGDVVGEQPEEDGIS